MKKIIILLLVSASVLLANTKSVKIYDVTHPASEPERLYIVTFSTPYDKVLQEYRVYCPTGMVRNITYGKRRKARKAYHSIDSLPKMPSCYRAVFDNVCQWRE